MNNLKKIIKTKLNVETGWENFMFKNKIVISQINDVRSIESEFVMSNFKTIIQNYIINAENTIGLFLFLNMHLFSKDEKKSIKNILTKEMIISHKYTSVSFNRFLTPKMRKEYCDEIINISKEFNWQRISTSNDQIDQQITKCIKQIKKKTQIGKFCKNTVLGKIYVVRDLIVIMFEQTGVNSDSECKPKESIMKKHNEVKIVYNIGDNSSSIFIIYLLTLNQETNKEYQCITYLLINKTKLSQLFSLLNLFPRGSCFVLEFVEAINTSELSLKDLLLEMQIINEFIFYCKNNFNKIFGELTNHNNLTVLLYKLRDVLNCLKNKNEPNNFSEINDILNLIKNSAIFFESKNQSKLLLNKRYS